MTRLGSLLRAHIGTSAGQWVIAGALLMVFVALAWVQRVPSLTTVNDDAMYVLLSRSLREGGFHSIHLADAPIHTKYPPGFPALLAVVSSVAGESIDAFVAMNIALAAVGLALTFAVAKRLWPVPVALGALAIGATSPSLQGIAGTVMSEPAFLALTALTLWLLAASPLTTKRVVMACVCASTAALTRTIGATLVLAVIGVLLLERRWRAAAVFGGVVVTIVVGATLWLQTLAMPVPAADYISDALDPGRVATSNPLAVVARRVATNAPHYAGGLLSVLSFPTIPKTLFDNVTWLAIACVALVTGAWIFWRRWRSAALFGLVYGALILVWPWAVGRFLLPLLPLVAVMFLAGVDGLLMKWNRRAAAAGVVAFAAIMAATGLVRAADKVAVKRRCDREQATQSPACFNPDQLSFFEAARYVASHPLPGAIVVSSKEATFHYLTNRRLVSADLLNARPADRAAALLEEGGVSYVVLGHLSDADVTLSTRLAGACRRLQPEREFPPRTVVFRVLAVEQGDGRACEILRGYARNAGQFQPQIF
jgi:hypothetical protein